MPRAPEQEARQRIDAQLEECGWIVQDAVKTDFSAGRGIAPREVRESERFKSFTYGDLLLARQGQPRHLLAEGREPRGERQPPLPRNHRPGDHRRPPGGAGAIRGDCGRSAVGRTSSFDLAGSSPERGRNSSAGVVWPVGPRRDRPGSNRNPQARIVIRPVRTMIRPRAL